MAARRWRRRLDGLAADFRLSFEELRAGGARVGRGSPDSRQRPAKPGAPPPVRAAAIIGELAAWPEHASWGEWLDRFALLAGRALTRPARVLETLADLRPMAGVGPVTLEQARDVLHDRLVTLDWEPPPRRYGRLFVGTPRSRRADAAFASCLVPGLAESRVMPQRPREDPLLLDRAAARHSIALLVTARRSGALRNGCC